MRNPVANCSARTKAPATLLSRPSYGRCSCYIKFCWLH
jgi:hypothetical protein